MSEILKMSDLSIDEKAALFAPRPRKSKYAALGKMEIGDIQRVPDKTNWLKAAQAARMYGFRHGKKFKSDWVDVPDQVSAEEKSKYQTSLSSRTSCGYIRRID